MAIATSSNYLTTKNGTKTHYTRCGRDTGPLLILLHGLGGSSHTFTPLLPYLPVATHDILSVDFKGFGATPLTKRKIALSIDRYVEDLESFITHLESTEDIIIIGHSLGSIVALKYAAKHSKQVKGLGLLGVGRSASHIPAARERMLGLAAKVRNEGIEAAAELATRTNTLRHPLTLPPTNQVPPGDPTESATFARAEVRKAILTSDPEGYAQICEAMVSLDHKDPDYRSITCPVVFVTGRDDTLSPPLRAKELASLLGGRSTVHLLQGGHQPILSDLQGTVKAISELFCQIKR
ncbi:hypothetical protein LTR17_010910 [Elasticomyces elasticus]|nr:hypothetical protein LTR17_010910 [Elasticomyces elasticus]